MDGTGGKVAGKEEDDSRFRVDRHKERAVCKMLRKKDPHLKVLLAEVNIRRKESSKRPWRDQ